MKKKSTKKKLLASPFRKEDRVYDWVFIIPAGFKHDSGYQSIAVVGKFVINRKEKYEICGYPDDVEWDLSEHTQKYPSDGLRMDCEYPSGIIRVWGRGKFQVEFPAYSSTEIKFLPKNE